MNAELQTTRLVDTERRRARRRQPALGTIYRLDQAPNETPQLGLVWNMSKSGVSLLMHGPLAAGTSLLGKLTTTDEAAALSIGLRIAHVRKLTTGDYVLGAQFQRALTTEELRPFLGQAEESNS